MYRFACRLTSRYFSLPILIVIAAMLMRAWIPQGYMPAQHSVYPNLTFCHVGLNTAQQSLLGIWQADEENSHFDNSQHCIFAAQAQAVWLKASGGALVWPALLPVLRVNWIPALPLERIPTVYSSLWARAPPALNLLS